MSRSPIITGAEIQHRDDSLFSLFVAAHQAAPARAYSPAINRLRGYALVLVLIYHCGGMLGRTNVIHGETGVDIFLIISGYILALNCAETPTAVFLRRRFFRIFPAYWLALALFVFLEACLSGIHYPWADLSLHVLGLHGFARAKFMWDINDSFWFISIIVFCYALFLAVRRHLEDLAFVVRVCCLATAGLAAYYLWFGHLANIDTMATRVPDFFVGLVAGQWASGRGLVFRPGFFLMFALALLAYVSVAYGIGYRLMPALVYIFAYACLEVVLAKAELGLLVLRVFGFLGTYSYELYLLHQPLMRNYNRRVMAGVWGIASPTQGQLILGMAAGFVAACVGAVTLHWLANLVLRSRWNPRSGDSAPSAAPTSA